MCQTVFKVLRILYERKQIKPCSCGVCILIFRDSYTAAIEQEDGQTACLLPEAKLLGEWKSNRKRFLGMWHRGKEAACQCRKHERRGFDPWVGKIPWRRAWQPTPVLLPGESPRTEEPWVRHSWNNLAHARRRVRANTHEVSHSRGIYILFHYHNNFVF